VAESLEFDILDRMVRAVEKVRERLLRTTSALDAAGVPYAVVGGNAVGAWVATVDEAAVRNTQDVDILLRREDLDRAKAALEAAGFIYRHAAGIDMFQDGPGSKFRDAVHVLFENEKVRPEYKLPTPHVVDSQRINAIQVLDLLELLKMKLTSNRDKDRTHVRDLIDVGLVDRTFVEKLPQDLAERLQHILDTPEG